MFEDLTKNVRFRQWLESVARGEDETYPDASSFSSDALAFLDRWDQARKEQRLLEQRHGDLLAGLASITGGHADDDEDKLLVQVRHCLKQAADRERHIETAAGRSLAQTRKELETTKAELDQARIDLEQTRAALNQAHAELKETGSALDKERRKLEPVLRYAYNLRRLLQAIQARGQLTPRIQTHIDKLLAAGGVSAHDETRKAS